MFERANRGMLKGIHTVDLKILVQKTENYLEYEYIHPFPWTR